MTTSKKTKKGSEKMYKIKTENLEDLSYIKPTKYAELLGLTPNIIYIIFRGDATTKLATAKAIISIAYRVAITDERMNELLEKHFEKVN